MKKAQSKKAPNIKIGKLRIAAYPDSELLHRLDTWCAEKNIDRASGLQYIMQTMLVVDDDSSKTQLNRCVSMLEEQVNRLSAAMNE
ncbi:MAG: hypothetical protein ACREPR_14955 [Brasilonema sp.]